MASGPSGGQTTQPFHPTSRAGTGAQTGPGADVVRPGMNDGHTQSRRAAG